MKHLAAILLLVLLAFTAQAQSPQSCVAIDADKLHSPLLHVLRLWGQQSKFWPQKSTLRVKFLDGTSAQRASAWRRFQKVDALVNLTFVRVSSGESEIRVAFRNSGHWSYVGNGALSIPQHQQTMNLQLSSFDSTKEWDRVAVHEILHAIGLDHEQAHPSANIPWNKPTVYADYARTQGWSKAQVDRQVLDRYRGNEFFGSEYDKDSIMQYPIAKTHVLDPKFAVGWNSRLSVMDLATLKRIYP